jgi:hypothetical protein
VYAWLSDFARYFELDPDKPHFTLPFSEKRQVYAMYMMALQAQEGEVEPCEF